MSNFIDLGASIFDADFSLNPYHYLRELYDRDDVLGFRSDGMNFLFRFDQARQLIFDRSCTRAMGDNEELAKLEANYAKLYPNRARHFQHSYTHGEPDMQFKAAIGKFVAQVAEQASFTRAEPVFAKLAAGGLLENYIDEVAKLPMQVFLDTCLLPYDDDSLSRLHWSGSAFLKSLENFYDEALIADCDTGLANIERYMKQHWHSIPAQSPLHGLISAGHKCGMNDEQLIANIGGMFLTAISNTVGISSAFMLRNLINQPAAWQQLTQQPELAYKESVIMELLRRDNHVKALSRQVNQATRIGSFELAAGEVVCLFFPGINMDHNHWSQPELIDFRRQFNGENNIIFGGSFYSCIGRRLTMAFLGNMIDGFIRHLPETARIDDSGIEMDGSWMAERIISRMPIILS